jgi:hypothetical protein
VTISLRELIAYWQGELEPEREAEVEEVIFEDAATARKLDAIARLDRGVRALVSAGEWQSSLTAEAVEGLQQAGLTVRAYDVEPGETVPCTIAQEDLVVIRLRGEFSPSERVDVVMDGRFEGMPEASERYDDVVVDQRQGAIVLVYPGDRIRALPRSQFRYRVQCGGRDVGDYGLDHSPPA